MSFDIMQSLRQGEENQEQQVIILILYCENLSVSMFCSVPMSWQEDVIIWCVAQEADEGDSDCWCPRGNVQATENTKLSQYWGKKHTRLWHYEGRTKCFLVSPSSETSFMLLILEDDGDGSSQKIENTIYFPSFIFMILEQEHCA